MLGASRPGESKRQASLLACPLPACPLPGPLLFSGPREETSDSLSEDTGALAALLAVRGLRH